MKVFAIFRTTYHANEEDLYENIPDGEEFVDFFEAPTAEEAVKGWNDWRQTPPVKTHRPKATRAEPATVVDVAGLTPTEAIATIASITGSFAWAANVDDVRHYLRGHRNYAVATESGRPDVHDQGDNWLVRGYATYQRVYIDPREFQVAPTRFRVSATYKSGPFEYKG